MKNNIFLVIILILVYNFPAYTQTILQSENDLVARNNINKEFPVIFSVPDEVTIINIHDQSSGLISDLVTSAIEGLYEIHYMAIITTAAKNASLLNFKVQYTDTDIEKVVIIPSDNIEGYNSTSSNIAGESIITGSLLIYAVEGSVISYVVGYTSNPETESDSENAMKYSLRVAVEKL
jgi:hypothetical protein